MSNRKEIIDAMARAAYVQAWANWAEENGESLRGELMDQAPSTPAAAKKWAQNLARLMEKFNGAKIEKLYARAALSADAASWRGGHGSNHTMALRRRQATPDNFGYCIAMESLGHGVGWGDDHPDHGYLVPMSEFYCHGEKDCDGYVSDSQGLAHRG